MHSLFAFGGHMPSRLTVDMSQFQDMSNAVARKVPFAVSQGINKTLKDATREVIRQIPLKLDRPKTFSAKQAIAQTYTKKSENPHAASIFIKDIQAKYLKWQIEGGTQTRQEHPVSPVNIKLTKKHGSIPNLKGGKVFKTRIAKGKHFVAKIRGITGLWLRYGRTKGKKRPKGGVKLVLAIRDTKKYEKGRLPFYKISEGVIKSKLPKHINQELIHALRPRRR